VTPREELRALLNGFRISAAVAVAAELGLSDELAAGPRTVADLARAVSADETTLRRLLRALTTVGVYAELADGSFANTDVGKGLRSDVPASMRPLARTIRDPAIWSAWGHLEHSVRTGENAFEALHGMAIWAHRATRPAENAIFNANMAAQSSMVAGAVAAAYDFAGRSSVVDVGGGQGVLLEAVLTAHEQLSGTVFDQAHAVATAPTPGSPGTVAARWASAAGSFFEAVPPADVHLLKSILHDWPDEQCQQILRTCAASLNPGGVVLVVETVLGRPGYELDAAFSDLNMLVLPGGQERTEAEYAELFVAAGLRLTRVIDTDTRFSIIEGAVAS
jgi:hypothetical protein